MEICTEKAAMAVRRSLSLCIGLVLVHCSVYGQFESILNDPDVIWAAKTEFIWQVEPAPPTQAGEVQTSNLNRSIKLIDTGAPTADMEQTYIASKLLDAARAGYFEVYELPEMSSRPLSKAELTARMVEMDTIIVIDPVTLMEKEQAVATPLYPENLRYIKARQLLFFRESTAEFEVYTYAYAPYFEKTVVFADTSVVLYYWPPFWCKMPAYKKKQRAAPNWSDNNITWAVQIKTFEEQSVFPDSLRTFKDFKPPILEQVIAKVADPEYLLVNGTDWVPLTMAQRLGLLSQTDTMVFFDAETYEEGVKIIKTELHADLTPQLRQIQDWWWDDKCHCLRMRLFAFAPALDVRDSNSGMHRFYAPVFWKPCTGKKVKGVR